MLVKVSSHLSKKYEKLLQKQFMYTLIVVYVNTFIFHVF